MALAELVQGCLEVVQYNTIRETFENESKFPERVDETYRNHRRHGQNIHDDEDDAKAHAEKEDAEARRHTDNLDESQLVAELDIPKEIDDGEYPPRITSQGKKRKHTAAC